MIARLLQEPLTGFLFYRHVYKAEFKLLVYISCGEVAEPVEGSRLLSGCGGNTSPRVRIPASPPSKTVDS
jgi:hypothetical protein